MPLIIPQQCLRPAKLWSGIDDASRGLVCGKAILSSNGPAAAPLIRSGLIRKDWALESLREFTGWVPFRKTFKIVIRAREGGELLWVRPFATEHEAAIAWARVCGLDIGRNALRGPIRLPGTFIEGELEYIFATVGTFNATTTDNTHDWSANGTLAPTNVNQVDYLVIAGGGAGGNQQGANYNIGGGGGGAGGYRTATAFAVTPGNSYTITVGSGGTGVTSGAPTNGSDSVFASITSTGGGFGAYDSGAGSGHTPGSGGSGGGGGFNNVAGGTGTGGQGNNGGGGRAAGGPPWTGGGGGGSNASGGNVSGSTGGDGGAGTPSSITGSSVTRAGGGGGGAGNETGTPGAAGSGGAGAGGTNAAGSAATANTGSGGGGNSSVAGNAIAYAGGNGALGVDILSWTPGGVVLDNSGTCLFMLP